MNEERPCTGDYACRENRVPMQMYCDLEQQNTKLKAQIDEVKETKYPVSLLYKGKEEIIFLNNKREQSIVVDLIFTLRNLCGNSVSKLEEVGK